MRSGFIVAAAQMLAVSSVHMIVSDFRLDYALIQTAITGMMSAVLTIGTLPFLENLFGVTSSIRFLELANPNHPLLKRMLVEAPGTYHHSIIVGNLAEAAANDIGADALLVRVGSLYHDIGKLKRPYFFIENQLTRTTSRQAVSQPEHSHNHISRERRSRHGARRSCPGDNRHHRAAPRHIGRRTSTAGPRELRSQMRVLEVNERLQICGAQTQVPRSGSGHAGRLCGGGCPFAEQTDS